MEEKKSPFTTACLKTDHENIYEASRSVFEAFAKKGKALLEMNLRKASLEDLFVELTEGSGADTVPEAESETDTGPEAESETNMEPKAEKEVQG